MDRKKITLIALSVLTTLSYSNSFAALNIYTNAVEQAEDASNAGNFTFNQQGLSSEETTVVSGFGKQMPLDLSLKIIIPDDWKVTLNKAAEKMPVNWQGKSTWPYVLENLAKDENLQVDVNWERRTVNVFSKDAEEKMIAAKEKQIKIDQAKRDKLQKQSLAAMKKAEEVRKAVHLQEKRLQEEENKLQRAKHYASLERKIINDYKKNNPGSNPSIKQVFTTANVLPLDRSLDSFVKMRANHTLKEFNDAIYILQEERMLSENLNDWARANGWSLRWKADQDFQIVNRIELKGNLLESVSKVLDLYKTSKKPIMANALTKNKVIEVKDFSYDGK